MTKKPLVISILAKSTAHSLPLYLKFIESQTEISKDTIFYIRTNDNKDNTSDILWSWYNRNNWKWKIYFDDSSIDESLKDINNHDWSDHKRFKILGKIRNQSVEFALSENADYFIADADNLILPHTIKNLRDLNLPVVAPYLRHVNPISLYANYHWSIDENGYMREDPVHYDIWNMKIKGIIEVPVIHCTYLIKNEILKDISYDDNSYRYEYVVFSDNLRKKGIPQYLDNREVYGGILFSADSTTYQEELNFPLTKELISRFISFY
jgi:hypothetical protein